MLFKVKRKLKVDTESLWPKLVTNRDSDFECNYNRRFDSDNMQLIVTLYFHTNDHATS